MQARSYDMENREIVKVLLSTGYLVIGHQGLVKIKEHIPAGEGDRYYCDCYFKDDTTMRAFDIEHIYYDAEVK